MTYLNGKFTAEDTYLFSELTDDMKGTKPHIMIKRMYVELKRPTQL